MRIQIPMELEHTGGATGKRLREIVRETLRPVFKTADVRFGDQDEDGRFLYKISGVPSLEPYLIKIDKGKFSLFRKHSPNQGSLLTEEEFKEQILLRSKASDPKSITNTRKMKSAMVAESPIHKDKTALEDYRLMLRDYEALGDDLKKLEEWIHLKHPVLFRTGKIERKFR